MRIRAAWLLGLCGSGCFLDSIGVSSDGGAPGTGAAGGSSSASSMTGGAGASGGGADDGGGGTVVEGGGGAIAQGAGGSGGSGGATPVCDGYLELDAQADDRAEIAANAAFDDPDSFAFGARVRLNAIPSIFATDNFGAAYVFEHDDGTSGYTLGFTERWDGSGDDEQPHAFVAVNTDQGYCEATADAVFPLGQWHNIAGTYDAASGTVRLYVDGAELDADADADCVGGIGAVAAPFAIGSVGPGFEGDVDDVFLRSDAMLPSPPTPITCSGTTIAAFDFDDGSLSTLCAGPAHTFTLLAPPADPVHVCP